MNGLLILDKPSGVTSRDVVNKVQTWFPRKTKIGHTGTLDPLATGVLVVCIGSATRLAEYVQQMSKVYTTRLLLGATSDTDDADGVIQHTEHVKPPDHAEIVSVLRDFHGEIEQVPPAFSAAKVQGRRAYDLARVGDMVCLEARRVRIDQIEILNYSYPSLEMEIRCGKGTYIRSLARDLGQRLGCGALVSVLRRTRVGPFLAEDGIELTSSAEEVHSRLLPADRAVSDLPRFVIAADDRHRLQHGQPIRITISESVETVAIFDDSNNVIGIGTIDQGWLSPTKILR